MAINGGGPIIQHLRRTMLRRDGAGMTDGQLLEEFVARRDEAAFEALVGRHGSMILGVCRRVLCNPHDAEDAFQATFLVLARKAASVSPREMVGNWLYGVAHTTAVRARAANAKRRARERQVKDMPEPETAWKDLRDDLHQWLDEELARLPDKYRLPIVLCHLEGRTRREVARQLKLPEGTLSSRLTTGREMLAKRLGRRGLVISGGMFALAASHEAASACVPVSLVKLTVKAAMLVAANQTATGLISVSVAALTEGVLKAMFLTKIKVVVVVMLMAAALSGTARMIYQTQATESAKERQTNEGPKAQKAGEASFLASVKTDTKPKTDKDRLQGTWKIVSIVFDEEKGKDDAEIVGEWTFKETTIKTQSQPMDMKTGATTSYLRFRLDETTPPKRIDLVEAEADDLFDTMELDKRFDDADERREGIYSLDGDTLKIRIGGKNGERPAAFENKQGSKHLLIVLKKDSPKNKFPDGRKHDFGKVPHGVLLKHTFRIVNTSDVPLQVTAVRVSCGCMTGSANKKALQPNEKGTVKIAIDTRRFVGPKIMRLYLETKHRGITETFPFSIKADSVEGQQP